MTIIYLKLKYCGYAYNLFERVLGDRQFVGETRDPVGIFHGISSVAESTFRAFWCGIS